MGASRRSTVRIVLSCCLGLLWLCGERVAARARPSRGWLGTSIIKPSFELQTRHGRLPASFYLDLRGGADDQEESSNMDDTDTTTHPYHLLSIFPANGASDRQHDWLPAGCTVLTSSAAATMMQGHPHLWKSFNLALMETLALVSDVMVLTFDDDYGASNVEPEVGEALQRGWQRRQAQGLEPARLWLVRTREEESTASPSDSNDNEADKRTSKEQWMDKVVLQDWTSQLAMPTSSPSLIQDWQLFQGPSEYAMAIRDFVQQTQKESSSSSYTGISSLVPMDGLPDLLSRVYTVMKSSNDDKPLEEEEVFLPSTAGHESVSGLTRLIQETLQDDALSTTTASSVPASVKDSGMEAPFVDTSSSSSPLWTELEQASAQLDDYWIAESSSGPSLPPDLVQVLQPILSQQAVSLTDDETEASLARLAGISEQHATILRDYYGRLYESLLEGGRASDGSAAQLMKQYESVSQRVIKTVGKYCQVKDNQDDAVTVVYQENRQGLQDDLTDITDRWKNTADVMFESDEDDADSTAAGGRRRTLPPWLQRFAVRALVLGVNYLQGWLAWQGIQRAALAREQQMPKFPLF